MSRTKRIYNRRLKKAQRDNIHLPTYINGIYINRTGFPLTWRSFICMGNCRMCKDHTKDQRLLRKKRKEQFRFDLRNELKKPFCHSRLMCRYCNELICDIDVNKEK